MVNCIQHLDKCHAACCRWLVFGEFKLTQDQLYYYGVHGCEIERVARGRYKIRVPTRCAQLTDDNLCRLHLTDAKPHACNKFDENNTKGYFIPESCLLNPKNSI